MGYRGLDWDITSASDCEISHSLFQSFGVIVALTGGYVSSIFVLLFGIFRFSRFEVLVLV